MITTCECGVIAIGKLIIMTEENLSINLNPNNI